MITDRDLVLGMREGRTGVRPSVCCALVQAVQPRLARERLCGRCLLLRSVEPDERGTYLDGIAPVAAAVLFLPLLPAAVVALVSFRVHALSLDVISFVAVAHYADEE